MPGWAGSFAASFAGLLGAPRPPHIPAARRGGSGPPSPTVTLRSCPRPWAEGTFPVHTKVSLAGGAQTWACSRCRSCPWKPALGPGVQVNPARVGWRSWARSGIAPAIRVGCVHGSAWSMVHMHPEMYSPGRLPWRWCLRSWEKVADESPAHSFGSVEASGLETCSPSTLVGHSHTLDVYTLKAPPLLVSGLPDPQEFRKLEQRPEAKK